MCAEHERLGHPAPSAALAQLTFGARNVGSEPR